MRWPWRRRRVSQPSEDACVAVEQVGRTSKDFDRLLEHVSEQKSKANTIARRADEVLARNHFAEAFELSMRRRAHR